MAPHALTGRTGLIPVEKPITVESLLAMDETV
jgi:hypothetical protein